MVEPKAVAVGALLLVFLAAGSAFAQDEALSSVGALGAGYMYTSYLAIGSITTPGRRSRFCWGLKNNLLLWS
jgi:hypothetical protein